MANNNKYDKIKTNMETGSTVTKMFHKFVDLTDNGLNYFEFDLENMKGNFLERPSFINVSVSAGTSFECGNLSEDYSIPVTNVTDSKGWIGEDNDGHRGYYLIDNNSNLYLFTKLFTYNGQKMPFSRVWNENKTKCHFEPITADIGFSPFDGFCELFDHNEGFKHLCHGGLGTDSIATGTGKTMYIDILNPTTGNYDQHELTGVEIGDIWPDFGVYHIYSSQLSTYFPGKTEAFLFYEKTMIAPTSAIKYGNVSLAKPNNPCVVNVKFNTESDLAARYQNSVLYL